ncbi:ABC transporter [Natrialba chahannaoensis JCM 10990]|uniref:ABC transporter n=1 Tax=Natrialba chahannaoensis JCM 10990 TaxID=1227492 RepID=M0AUI2_9EURY|nr:ABC transporter ATP-binding protein [Natrialba chahannaoensis]ELZ01593.1 ABC transporter [Natrialba chahannaoensis JCM 10990]
MNIIETDSLTKRYGQTLAVDSLDLSVREGEVFGFLGPNGSGKSTTIDTLLGFVYPSSGTASVFGMDPAEDGKAIRQRTGVVPDGCELMSGWTGRDHLEFEIESRGVEADVDAQLERFGLLEDADRVATGYSRGMTQRLLLAMASAGDPDLLILDEPSTGLDPNGVAVMQELVREAVESGTTVFFSSHQLSQVESVCDRVGILHEGALLATDSIDSLRSTMGATTYLRVSVDRVPSDVDSLQELDAVDDIRIDGRNLQIQCDGDAQLTVLNHLDQLGATPRHFETERASLQEIFRSYTSESTAGAD